MFLINFFREMKIYSDRTEYTLITFFVFNIRCTCDFLPLQWLTVHLRDRVTYNDVK